MLLSSFIENYQDFTKTFYAVDSTVYISFDRVNRVDLLLEACDGNAVLTPKIEKEIFLSPTCSWESDYSINSIISSSAFGKWIRTPLNRFSTLSTGDYRISSSTFLLTDYGYRQYFYVANTNYVSMTTSLSSTAWQYDFSKLNSDADREIVRWVLENPSNAELLSNERKMVNSLRPLNVTVTRSIGILCRAIQKNIISLKEANDIYQQWASIDPGSCKWKKIRRGYKKLVSFQDIYSDFETNITFANP